MHKLDAERLAVGALENGHDLPQRANSSRGRDQGISCVVVRIGEAVRTRIELLRILRRLEAERIEICVQVATRPIGANQHERLNRVACCLLHGAGRYFNAFGLGRGQHFVADTLLDLSPVGVECEIRSPWGAGGQSGRCQEDAGVLDDVRPGVLESGKKQLPLRIDGLRVRLVARIELVNVIGMPHTETKYGES